MLRSTPEVNVLYNLMQHCEMSCSEYVWSLTLSYTATYNISSISVKWSELELHLSC